MKIHFLIGIILITVACKKDLEPKKSKSITCLPPTVAIKTAGIWENLNPPPGLSAKQYVSDLKASGVKNVELNYRAHAMGFADNVNSLASSTWDDDDIGASELWSTYNKTGSLTEIVAVLDTGVEYYHQDIDANIAADIRNQSTSVIWDKVDKDTDPDDFNGHGTHVAGIIGGEHSINGGSDAKGINDSVSILPIRVLDENGGGNYSTIANGIQEAINQGAHIINMSLGAYEPASSILTNAIEDAVNAGIIVVVAAGNAAFDNNIYASYPSNSKFEALVSVQSHNNIDSESYFTNFGTTSVHLSGPGEGITSSFFNNSYKTFSGTSMSAPQIAGSLALLRQIAREIGGVYTSNALNMNILVRSALLHTTTQKGYRNMTGGKANVFAAANLISGTDLYAGPSYARSKIGRSFRLVAAGGSPPYTFTYDSGDEIGSFEDANGNPDAIQTNTSDEAWFTVNSEGMMKYLVTDSTGETFVGQLDSRSTEDQIYLSSCE